MPIDDGLPRPRAAAPGCAAEPACLWIYPPVRDTDVARLREQLRALLRESDTAVVLCDVAAVTDPDISTVEALAQLQLTARRLGRFLQLRGPCGKLTELLTWTGLSDVFPPSGESSERAG